ncbi:MAG: 23S rRNA methyltransferase [Gammaproteobacteria bacterium]|nr:MAG: 23S rRNA methyltransferase [Gammaproteobacteria bacterium]
MAAKKRRTASSARWLAEHEKDPFVQRSRKQGYRSRAVYKLDEMHRKLQLLHRGMTVVDLGAAPGAWSQYAAQKIRDGRIVAVDLLDMEDLDKVDFVRGDLLDPAVRNRLKDKLGSGADLVLSDIAPNMSGIPSVDQARSIGLAEMALHFAVEVLKPGGNLLVKTFQGAGLDEFRHEMQLRFRKVGVQKPEASRSRSRELYLYGSCLKEP